MSKTPAVLAWRLNRAMAPPGDRGMVPGDGTREVSMGGERRLDIPITARSIIKHRGTADT